MKAKITCDRLGRIDWDDEAAIRVDGEMRGTLTRDTAYTCPIEMTSKVVGYTVEVWDADGEHSERKEFDVRGILTVAFGGFGRTRGKYDSVRDALTAAKRWARETLSK